MNIEKIKQNGTYEVIESFDDRRIVAGTKVKVVEIREADRPFVFCHGLNGGSAYINCNNLRKAKN